LGNGELRGVEGVVDRIEKDEIGRKGSLEDAVRGYVMLVAVEYSGDGVAVFSDDDFSGLN